jgi:hypothetical protein
LAQEIRGLIQLASSKIAPVGRGTPRQFRPSVVETVGEFTSLKSKSSVPMNKPAPYVAAAALLSVLKAIVLLVISAAYRVKATPPTRCVAEFSEIVLLTSVAGKLERWFPRVTEIPHEIPETTRAAYMLLQSHFTAPPSMNRSRSNLPVSCA